MCTYCPRCNSLAPCNDAYEEGHDEAGNYDPCIDVYEHPWICQYCLPDVEM